MTNFCHSVIKQVEDTAQGEVLEPEKYIEIRRKNVATEVLYALYEYA